MYVVEGKEAFLVGQWHEILETALRPFVDITSLKHHNPSVHGMASARHCLDLDDVGPLERSDVLSGVCTCLSKHCIRPLEEGEEGARLDDQKLHEIAAAIADATTAATTLLTPQRPLSTDCEAHIVQLNDLTNVMQRNVVIKKLNDLIQQPNSLLIEGVAWPAYVIRSSIHRAVAGEATGVAPWPEYGELLSDIARTLNNAKKKKKNKRWSEDLYSVLTLVHQQPTVPRNEQVARTTASSIQASAHQLLIIRDNKPERISAQLETFLHEFLDNHARMNDSNAPLCAGALVTGDHRHRNHLHKHCGVFILLRPQLVTNNSRIRSYECDIMPLADAMDAEILRAIRTAIKLWYVRSCFCQSECVLLEGQSVLIIS